MVIINILYLLLSKFSRKIKVENKERVLPSSLSNAMYNAACIGVSPVSTERYFGLAPKPNSRFKNLKWLFCTAVSKKSYVFKNEIKRKIQ